MGLCLFCYPLHSTPSAKKGSTYMPENHALAESPRDSDVGYAKLTESLRATSQWCGVPLSFVMDLFDALKRLCDERSYADLHIEIKAGKPWRLSETQTRQYGNEP